ncbi:DinB family protein [Chryseobacterium phosphatilyticum]|uniref:DinB family protein n=1 Tax=Chryseobacterium phosphatilyticum TaxID=475075 RepID=A0A316X6T3_9FLAO|nr:DinB family protein [Chryseobacterium phosphatilyticum]PWN69387.1 DinB family protein [Chryseobacterium phosphatilyticum]
MTISTSQLLDELIEMTQQHLHFAETLLIRPEKELNNRMSADSWSTLECLEHLNRYGDFYIPEINRHISATGKDPQLTFRPGFLGNYFVKMIQPKEKLNSMKTIKEMNPVHTQLDKKVIEKFVKQQEELLELLWTARNVDLEKVKTGVSISRWIKLKLGDTFRFVIFHNARHIAQAKRVLKTT